MRSGPSKPRALQSITPSATSATHVSGSGGSTPTTVARAGSEYPIRITKPSEILRHDISDEELNLLASTKRDSFSEAFWAMVGAAVVALPPAIKAIVNYAHGASVDGVGILEIAIFLVTVSIGGTIWVVGASRSKTASNLVAEIRARSRQSS